MSFPASRSLRPLLLAATCSLLVIAMACGGGSATSGSQLIGALQVVIRTFQTTVTINAGNSTTFSATVTNTANTTVLWSVQEGAAGGTITNAGVYIAPATAGTYHVIATAQADPTKTASITITVIPPAPVERAKFIYTSNTLTLNPSTSPPANISAFSIDSSTGALTPLPNSPVALERDPFFITLDVQQNFLLLADPSAGLVRVYRIDQNTAALQEVKGSPYPAGQEPSSIAVHPSNQFVYVTGLSSSNVYAFRFDGTSGTLTPIAGSPFPAAANSVGSGSYVAVDPSGKFLYMTDISALYAFQIDSQSGALTLVNSFPEYLPGALAIDPNDAYLYLPASDGTIQTYSIDPTSGTLSLAFTSPMVNRFGAYMIQLDRTGHFAYTVEDGQYLQVYTVAEGRFSPVGPNRTGALGSLTLAIDPSGQFLYAPQTGSEDNINGWRIDPTTGSVTLLSTSPFSTQGAPTSIAVVVQH